MATKSVKIAEAKARFSELVRQVREGEDFIIQYGNEPVARLVAFDIAMEAKPRVPGLARHWRIPDDLFKPDPEQEAIDAGDYTDAVGIWVGKPAPPKPAPPKPD